MKDTIDRPAAVRVLASVPAWKVPVVAMATPVDPILSAIERDRLAHVAFVTSVNRTNEGKQHRKRRATSHKPMRTPTRPPAASGRMLLVKPRDDGVWRSELGGACSLSPLPTIRGASSRQRPPHLRTCTASSARSSSHSRSHRVSSFRGLPQSVTARTRNCLDFG